MTLGPGQPQLHSLETKVYSLDSLWGRAERYLGVCCLLYLPNLSSSLYLRALTCSDLGCTVEPGPTHSSSAPAASPSVACSHRLSWDGVASGNTKSKPTF